jgi:hypothetical protein
MKTIHSSQIQKSGKGIGYIIRMAAFVLGAAFFLSAATTAKADTMTQLEYIQFLVALSGDNLGPNATPQDYVNWALARGLNPDGGWQTDAKLAKNVVAQTVAQLVNIVPRKNVGNYVALLAQNGIHVPNGNQISRTDLIDFIDTGLAGWLASFGAASPSSVRQGSAPTPGSSVIVGSGRNGRR